MFKHLVITAFSLLILSACSSGGGGGGFACPQVIDYAGGVTVTGNALYEFRIDGNQGIDPTPNPIRFAEVQVLNSAGGLVQCGTTSSTGTFSVKVPKTTANHTVRVYSKINNPLTKISVYNNPFDRVIHSITSSSFQPSADRDIGSIVATAATAGPLKGGAFNILDKMLAANLYLKSETEGCSTSISACVPFTGNPQLSVFWDKGVDPGTYFGITAGSFYIQGYSELYLLGGSSGDVANSDTDHFDNTIIVHEYGHFIEEQFADSDSPGGEHNGRQTIDPRLAWGEGWANFFKAAALNEPTYRDTFGTNDPDGTPTAFQRDLETPDVDIPSQNGEGNFREYSISRLLWDAIDSGTDSGTDLIQTPFYELWTLFTSPTIGMKSTSRRFRNVGLFHQLQVALGFSDWSTLRTNEKHAPNQDDYINIVTRGGSCPDISITAADNLGWVAENGTLTNSNLFASNDFYQYSHPGGAFNLLLEYSPTPQADLDLYLFKEDYRLADTTTYAATPARTRRNNANDGVASTENINVANLPAGRYVINIRVHTGLNYRLGSADYNMILNGANLCPN